MVFTRFIYNKCEGGIIFKNCDLPKGISNINIIHIVICFYLIMNIHENRGVKKLWEKN